MHYQTIALELLMANPDLHQQLKATRQLLPAVKEVAADLKRQHQAWVTVLTGNEPARNPRQLSSAAMELAVEELRHRLSSPASATVATADFLDQAMAYLRRHTPPA